MIYAHTNKPLIYSLRMCVCLPHIYAKGPSTACVQRKNLLIHTIEENPKCALHKHKRYYSLYTLRGTYMRRMRASPHPVGYRHTHTRIYIF